jgi:2-methylcitrate dehydratase
MTQGARVPGTSLELDPAMAAFNLGAMMGMTALAAILPVADYLARKAHNEARVPLVMHDVLTAMVEAGEFRPDYGMVYSTAAVLTRLAGGSAMQIAVALGADPQAHTEAPTEEAGSRWAAGAAAARAVRLAFGALCGAPDESAALPQRPEREDLASPRQDQDFAASVAALFPRRQAALIGERLADQAAVEAMPVHEFVALLVRNG